LNKGTAFTDDERTALGLHGLLPPTVETLEQQCARAYKAYKRKQVDLDRHIFLRGLQDRNEILFYALVERHISEMAPMIYTPVVAEACRYFSHIYRHPRGLFLSYPLADRMEQLFKNRPNRDVDVIVVSDGERILGIGDQGANGMGIPIGKLSLYSLMGGIEPSRTLPVLLDAGTNNPDHLGDPEYIGWRHERITGQAYWDFVDQFVTAVQRTFPNVLLQWEDFAKPNARPILDKYRDRLCTFNDDIQGTAAVVLGALHGALKATNTRFRDQQVVILGAGGAGTGVAEYFSATMVAEGCSETEARQHFYLIGRSGLLHTGMRDLSPFQQKFCQPIERVAGWRAGGDGPIGLADVVKHARATILIGLSTEPGTFTREIVCEMADKVGRPIIFPLSNPDNRAEAVPADLIHWTDGRALVATGAPFPPVSHGGRKIEIGQCNNFFIFPAMGLAVAASRATRVTDGMLLAAARALGECAPARTDPAAPLLPPLEKIYDVSIHIAMAVAAEAQRSGVAPKANEDQLRRQIIERFWAPRYPHIEQSGAR
jgi:malate dehydrogenase (oxaloacetate-decarboxylating)